MRKTVRLSGETEQYIYALRKLYELEIPDLRLFKSNVINKAFGETSDYTPETWYTIAETKIEIPSYLLNEHDSEFKASNNKLNLTYESVEGIESMFETLPAIFNASWVTTGFCIKLMVKGALLKKLKEEKK